jgi:uncharacterized membrane protein (DUF4010 family)
VREWDEAVRLAIAALVGAGIGLEREWSGHASGPQARFAGLRTFFLLGILGGCAGLFASMSAPGVAIIIAAGGLALAVAAYVTAQRRPEMEPDGTTEAAALVVIALGAIAGSGSVALAAGAGSIVVLALSEKARLHWLVRRLGDAELHAALQFCVLALVVLPLLPSGPLFGAVAIRPRALWAVVLLFSALNFSGFIARRALGPNRGYGVAGMLGGVISSTAVTLSFARQSRRDDAPASALALGVIGACTVLVPRVIAVSAVLNADVAVALARLLIAPLAIGAAIVAVGWRSQAQSGDTPTIPKSPLRLATAIKMAVAFQVAMTAIAFVRGAWGMSGLYASGAVLGLTDVDALTVSMSQVDAGVTAGDAARAIAVGILANTVLKLGVSVALGGTAFRRVATTGLGALAVASALSLWLL